MNNSGDACQDAAYALLAALKAMKKDMTVISGSTYALDSYRQACIAVTQAEGIATVQDLRKNNLT